MVVAAAVAAAAVAAGAVPGKFGQVALEHITVEMKNWKFKDSSLTGTHSFGH